MLKEKGKKFLVLLMLASVVITSAKEVTHACRPPINSTNIVCMQNIGRSKKHKGNNVMWEKDFLNRSIIDDFGKDSKQTHAKGSDGVLVKRLRRKLFIKKIIGYVVNFVLNEF